MRVLAGNLVLELEGADFLQDSRDCLYSRFLTDAVPDVRVRVQVGRERSSAWTESRLVSTEIDHKRRALHVERTEGTLDLALSCDQAEIRLRGPWPRAMDAMLSTVVQVGALLLERGVTLHASAVAREGRALLFTGRSGAGKSTAALSGARVDWRTVAEDITYVAFGDGSPPAVRTLPFWQRGGTRTSPERLCVDRICYLRKTRSDAVAPLTVGQGMRRLMETVSIGVRYAVTMEAASAAALRLAESVPIVDLRFAKSCTFWPLLDVDAKDHQTRDAGAGRSRFTGWSA